MITPEIQNWLVKPECGTQQLISMLEKDFQVKAESEADLDVVTLMDDFDWDVWNANSLLLRSKQNTWKMYAANEMAEAGDVDAGARFWWELPQSELKDKLKELVDLRAVMPVVDVHLSRTDLVLRNDDDKIVVRMVLTTLTDIAEQEAQRSNHFIQIKSLRGYLGPFKTAIKLMEHCLAEQLDSLSMKTMMQLHGYGPVDHDETSKNYGITEDEAVEPAIRQMSLLMLQTARHNEQGVIDDIDTEFLHQYRVSLRKTRSLLNLMKKALPADVHLKLKTLLAELASATNMLRDMDVFLLERDYYQAMLPENFSAGFSQLFRMIAADREKARKSVYKSFKSAKHSKTFDDVFKLLESEPVYASDIARKPVLKAAKKKILSRYHRLSLVGSEIHEGTPDDDVHALRIECKKLRYLMEFFAELFPKKRIRQLIKSLKKLQTILGNFNDYSVQKEFLTDYEKNHKTTPQLSAAINGLIAVLHQKQIAERQKVQQAFALFNDDQTVAEFQALFGKQKVGK